LLNNILWLPPRPVQNQGIAEEAGQIVWEPKPFAGGHRSNYVRALEWKYNTRYMSPHYHKCALSYLQSIIIIPKLQGAI